MDDDTSSSDGYEYAPLRFHSPVDSAAARAQLTVAAEYGGWELARVLRYADGRRRVTLRRKAGRQLMPGLTW